MSLSMSVLPPLPKAKPEPKPEPKLEPKPEPEPKTLNLSRFARLPAELRLRVWAAACPMPAMHVFDLCSSTTDGVLWLSDKDNHRSALFKDTVFLDRHWEGHRQPKLENAPADPSMYRRRLVLEAVCFDASVAVAVPSLPRHPGGWAVSTATPLGVFTSNVNTIYLPGPHRQIHYNNQTDVLHLCLGRRFGGALGPAVSRPPSTSSLLNVQWSDEAAEAIRTARRIALDADAVVAMTGKMEKELFELEIAFLASILQQRLEVLYLVDDCPGRQQSCERQSAGANELAGGGDGALQAGLCAKTSEWQRQRTQTRQRDVIWGVGRTYREVMDLEGLGWAADYAAYRFAQAIGDAVREQQRCVTQTCQFKGVRVLLVEPC